MIVLVLYVLCFECDHVFNKNSSNFGVRLEARERDVDRCINSENQPDEGG